MCTYTQLDEIARAIMCNYNVAIVLVFNVCAP